MIIIRKLKVIDLFSGAGGLSLGFKQTGKVDIVAAAENNQNARKTYKRNFKEVERLYSDVRNIDYTELRETVGAIDLVIGGPPCQGFSNANRQHSTIISMNNRLVKEYVRAICQLQPKAFVMENVAMLRSQVHRFFIEETDLNNERINGLNLHEDDIEILSAKSRFDGAKELILTATTETPYLWAKPFYKVINLLYRYRINQAKFDLSLKKHQEKLLMQLKELALSDVTTEPARTSQQNDHQMAEKLLQYINAPNDFTATVDAIEQAILVQRAMMKIKELTENHIHIFGYTEKNGGLYATVRSYSVIDYIKGILENEPFNYILNGQILNAIDYGAPQRRERFIVVGIKKDIHSEYAFPKACYTSEMQRTVHDAISDLEGIPPTTTTVSDYVELPTHPNAVGLEKELRGKLLYNHVTTATRETAMARFKALKAGENFHDLAPNLKTTYSNAARTQNTIYMRLRYDEPCGTVVNVRKSMWIHPVLDRAISIREAARLQTFPDTFVFEGTKDSQYQQVGNAVPPFLAKAVADSIISILIAEE